MHVLDPLLVNMFYTAPKTPALKAVLEGDQVNHAPVFALGEMAQKVGADAAVTDLLLCGGLNFHRVISQGQAASLTSMGLSPTTSGFVETWALVSLGFPRSI